MILGRIALEGFAYQLVDGEKRALGRDGQPTGEPTPVKILAVQDVNSGLQIQLSFLPNELEQFISLLQGGGKIVPASMIAPFPIAPFPTRNGMRPMRP